MLQLLKEVLFVFVWAITLTGTVGTLHPQFKIKPAVSWMSGFGWGILIVYWFN